VNLLLDTHLLLWAATHDAMMTAEADRLVKAPENVLWFSVASLWEVAIKRALDRPDFRAEASVLRAGLLSNGYREIGIEGRHVLALPALPGIHRDPFDRILIAQAKVEGLTFLTVDGTLAAYGDAVRTV
jgi:PIN domain nuclease of toxin-antitoxin system